MQLILCQLLGSQPMRDVMAMKGFSSMVLHVLIPLTIALPLLSPSSIVLLFMVSSFFQPISVQLVKYFLCAALKVSSQFKILGFLKGVTQVGRTTTSHYDCRFFCCCCSEIKYKKFQEPEILRKAFYWCYLTVLLITHQLVYFQYLHRYMSIKCAWLFIVTSTDLKEGIVSHKYFIKATFETFQSSLIPSTFLDTDTFETCSRVISRLFCSFNCTSRFYTVYFSC